MCIQGECAGWSTFVGWNAVTQGLLFMLIDGVLFTLLGLYFDVVFPGKWGVGRHPLFFLSPIYNVIKKKKRIVEEEETSTLIQVNEEGDVPDEDVVREAERVCKSKLMIMMINHIYSSYDDLFR
jgi:hypothetical protein